MDAPSSVVAATLARWRDNLLDLTHHNPLLSLPSKRSLTISHPGAAVVVQRLLEAGKAWSFWLPPAVGEEDNADLRKIETKPDDVVCGDLDREELLAALSSLQKQSECDRVERGLHTLHVACGFLEWHEATDSAPFRSPIVLVPVRLEGSSPLKMVRPDERPAINPALRMRLRQDFDLTLPALPDDWSEKSVGRLLDEIDAMIGGLPGWRVERAVGLALFPVFKEALHSDLEKNLARAAVHPLVRALAGEPANDASSEDIQTQGPILPIAEIDDGQRLCLERALRGHSLVIDGPAGSGKSQTIANLIADRLAAGKTLVLISERKPTAVCERFRAAGLGDYCLVLHRPGTDLSGLAAELQRVLDAPPPADAEVPSQEVENLQERQADLNAYLQALHVPREPLGKSAGWALEQVARCEDLPRIPLRLADGDLTPDWLSQAQAAVERLQKLWRIAEECADFPWWGFKADGRYTQKLRDELNNLLERIRCRMDRFAAAARDYGAKIGATGSASWLLRMADLLESSPAPPAFWLTTDDLSQLPKDLERGASGDQLNDHLREPLTARYGPDIWRLPAGTRAGVERCWHAVAPLLAPGDEQGAGLLTHQQQFRGWAADTQRRIPGWLSDARALEKWLGITLPFGAGASKRPGQEDPSVQGLKHLHRLANLCMAENAPERSWILDAGALEQARKLIASCRPVFADVNKRRAALLERYTEKLFELDLPSMGERFAGPYRSWLRMFNMQFRRDRRALRRRARMETLPSTWWQDVIASGDVARRQAGLEAEQPARQAVLGRYEKNLATDFDAAERATRIAAEAVELAGELGLHSLPARLVEALSTTAPPPEKARAALKRLHDTLGAWQHATEELKGYLPMDSLPGAGVPLEESALAVLGGYAGQLQASLNEFAAAADPVLTRALAPPSDAVALLDDLHQVEELRAQEETQETASRHGAARPGSAFQSTFPDMQTQRKALNWSMRLRELCKAKGAVASAEPLPEQLVKIAVAGAPAAPSSKDLRHANEQLDQSLHALENRFEPPGPLVNGKRYADLPLEELTARINTLRQRVGELADWVEWRHMPQRLEQLGLGEFWAGLQNARPPRERLADVFTKSVLESWLDRLFKDDPILAEFQRQDHERNVAEHRDASERLHGHNAQRLASILSSRRQQASDPALAALREKRLNGEQMLNELHDRLQRIKPCFIMSPCSVGQFLSSSEMAFDLAVFDDASEIRLEDALGTIFRSRQVVVAGNSAQPPPAHFTQWEFEAGNLDDMPVVESLLDGCLRAGVPEVTLHEQYGPGAGPESAEAPAPGEQGDAQARPPVLSRRVAPARVS
jgi:hypothetical protein